MWDNFRRMFQGLRCALFDGKSNIFETRNSMCAKKRDHYRLIAFSKIFFVEESKYTEFSFYIPQGGEVLEEHCTIELHDGIATLESKPDAQCWVNSQLVDKESRLTQG